jgi:putative tryptophan/tyrosine transport system substrate-binding protein
MHLPTRTSRIFHAGKYVVALGLLALASAALGQANRLPRVGWILSGTAEGSRPLVDAMRAGMADEGMFEGRSVVLDIRYLDGRTDRYAEVFADIVRHPVDLLTASGPVGIPAARDASAGRVPVSGYFCGTDVAQMVESYARPGGNLTGVSCFSAELAVKRIELLKDAIPSLRRIGFLYDPRNPGKAKELADVRDAAGKLGMTVATATVSAVEEFRAAIGALRRDRAEAVVTSEDPFTYAHRALIVALAAEHQMPDISAFREFVTAGGVLSYGAITSEGWRQMGRYAARLIRGTKPSELPIWQPMRFEFVVNLKAARALGITIPKVVLMRADDVIE